MFVSAVDFDLKLQTRAGSYRKVRMCALFFLAKLTICQEETWFAIEHVGLMDLAAICYCCGNIVERK